MARTVHPCGVSFFGAPVQRSTHTLNSDGYMVAVELFRPQNNGTHPAVIALHGSGGLQDGWAEQPASLLAGRGFAVFVLHYFERTATNWADDRTIRENFAAWMKTISDAITFASKQSGVDGGRVALLGFSLGAYLALSVATQDSRVKAVIDFFGGMPQELTRDLKPMPPVLILHGEDDPVVPVAEAYRLQHLFEANGTQHEVKVYPGAGHGFSGFDMLDAGQRTLGFLQRHLR